MEQDQFLFVAEFHWDARKDGAIHQWLTMYKFNNISRKI